MIPTELDISKTRLNNAEAARLEFELAKAKREYLTIPECFGFLNRLRVTAIEKTPGMSQGFLKNALDEEIVNLQEVVQKFQESARW